MQKLLLIAFALFTACSHPPEAADCLAGADGDGDGVVDACDNCRFGSNSDQADSDHDGMGDRCDPDDDQDNVPDDVDRCPWVHDGIGESGDTDGDGVGDACDPCPGGDDLRDGDGDGLNDCIDRCPTEASENNDDRDADGVGDACDNCPDTPNSGQADIDFDRIGDICDTDDFVLEEASLADVQAEILSQNTTCAAIVEGYLARVHRFDLDVHDGPPYNSFVMLNESVRQQAAALDDVFADTGQLTGPLHCAVVVVKSNFGTVDTDVTNGSLAALGVRTKSDAFTVSQLRRAGAVLLGATAMDEFAKGIYGIGGAHGRTGNAYDPRRNPGGSSSGSAVAVAANFALAGMGTDNCASLTLPASYNGLVTIRATRGLISTRGIFPSNPIDAVAGPLARTVIDMTNMLDVMAADDPDDQLRPPNRRRPTSYLDHLRPNGLVGKRIGVLRALSADTRSSIRAPFDGSPPDVQRIWRQTFERLDQLGAEVVDNITLPGFDPTRYGTGGGADVDAYLYNTAGPHRGLADLCDTEMFSRDVWKSAAACKLDLRLDQAVIGTFEFGTIQYDKNRAYIEGVMDALNLDALMYPADALGGANVVGSKDNCIVSSVSGLPAVVVPVGLTPDRRLPVGMTFLGRQWDEGRLIEIAYGWEQQTLWRTAPILYARNSPTAPMDIPAFNNLSLEVARRAFDSVLRDNSRFELTGPVMENVLRAVLEEREEAHWQ